MKRRILAIVVLYKLAYHDSVSYTSLLGSAARLPSDALDLGILLYDNTPQFSEAHDLPSNVRYIPSPLNSGLSTAYNMALQTALDEGYDWLLTLDQDTELPDDTMLLFLEALIKIEQYPYAAAVVPQIRASGRIVSPNYFAGGAWPRWFSNAFAGIPDEDVYAFNSGSLIKTAALKQVGGYSPWFWLDNSDSYIYRQLQKFGKRVYVAGNLELNHDFSMLNMQDRVSPERYKTILLSESAFWDLEMNGLAGVERTARLIGRLAKHLLRKDDPRLRKLTVDALFARLFRTRSQRLATWRSFMEKDRGPAEAQSSEPTRPMVSVCMAAYNGERFVRGQLESILIQLDPGDELVIFDDCGTDGTLEIIREVIRECQAMNRCPKIVLVSHRENQGVVATFEDAVRTATGDILFLADDDDLWDSQKVKKVLEAFSARPNANIVCTAMTLIDENDRPRADAELTKHRHFTAHFLKNLLHNQYQGSAMAFRSTILRSILPFPKRKLFLHDAWIGGTNTLFQGEAVYIDEPLLLYRRHSKNYSRRFSLWNQIRLRVQLIGAYLGHSFRRH